MIVVTGTGRSGTGYMSKLLTSAGIKSGHETLFNTDTFKNSKELKADCSWLAAPFLHKYPTFTIVHAVREPIKVINSFLNIQIFLDIGKSYKYYTFMSTHLPSLNKQKTNVDKVFCYVIEWTNKILKYKDEDRYIFHRIEDNPIPLLKRLKASKTKNIYKETNYNTRTSTTAKDRKWKLTDNDIPEKWKDGYFKLKKDLGYQSSGGQ